MARAQKGDSKPGYWQIPRRPDDQNSRADRRAVIADKAFDANWIIAELNKRGAKVVISQRPKRKAPLEIDLDVYKWRHLIENFFCKLKEFKRVAMRSDKTDTSFAAMIYLGAAIINSR